MVDAFDTLHRPEVPGCALTVGARALAKHAHRGKAGYWATVAGEGKGGLKGGDREKSFRAKSALKSLLASAVWANTHALPGNVLVHEVREQQGYGARWHVTGNQCVFRGFLEPQMAYGHDKKWRH